MLGHEAVDVVSKIVNKITSGAFIVSIAVGISSIVGSDSVCSDHIDTGQSGDRFPGLVFVY